MPSSYQERFLSDKATCRVMVHVLFLIVFVRLGKCSSFLKQVAKVQPKQRKTFHATRQGSRSFLSSDGLVNASPCLDQGVCLSRDTVLLFKCWFLLFYRVELPLFNRQVYHCSVVWEIRASFVSKSIALCLTTQITKNFLKIAN